MAELTIALRHNPETGKKDIIIHLESDADALPHEHEEAHRELVEKIIGKGKSGKVIVERESEKTAPPTKPNEELAPQKTAQGQGS
jgi:hypothetical protein